MYYSRSLVREIPVSSLDFIYYSNMEIKSTAILRVLPAREAKVEIRTNEGDLNIKTLTESRTYKFQKIINKSQANRVLWDYLTRGVGSLVSSFLSGTNTVLVSYGEVNSGKSYSIFGSEEGTDLFSSLLTEIFKSYSSPIGLSVWEIVYSSEDRSERVVDLLKISETRPMSSSLLSDFVSIEVSEPNQGLHVLECAKELSSNFKARSDGGFRCLNNRAHFFVRLVLEKFSLCVVDLAGSLPGVLSPEIRVKLGCDEQLNVTRIGLNQYRSIMWEMAKNPGISSDVLTASRKSKLSLILSPILTMGKNFFLTAVKEDSEFEDICKNLDVLYRASNIVTRPAHYPHRFKLVPFLNFVNRAKVPRYWDSGKEESREEPVESKQSLKDQISQMIMDLDNSPAKNSYAPQDTVIIKQVSVDNSKLDTSLLRMQIFQQEIEELRVSNEVEIENLKLENCNLKQKIRILQENSEFLQIFDMYELEIAKLEKVIKSLRDEQVNALAVFENSVEIIEKTEGEIETLQRKYKLALKDSVKYSKSLETSLLNHEKDLNLIKKNERKWLLSRRCFENMSKKTVVQESIIGKQTKFLQLNESTFQEMIQELEKLQKEVSIIKSENSALSSTNKTLEEELKIMKEIAATSGMPEETLKRIHKNLSTPDKVQVDFVINLLKRFQLELKNKKQESFLDNIIHEVSALSTALVESKTREKNLFEVLMSVHSSLDSGDMAKETNRELRKALLAQLL